MTNITGGCLCGQVRCTIAGVSLRSGICHCRSCQHYTGSAFEPFMIFPTTSVNLQGELSSFGTVADSGNTVFRRFCPNCGSGVINQGAGASEMTIVLVGILDDPTVFTPNVEIMCDTAWPWVHGGSERKRFRRMPV